MKEKSRVLSGGVRRWLLAISAALGFLALSWGANAQTPSTNTFLRGVPLAELLKRWDGASLDQVRQAADRQDPYAQHYLGYCYVQGFRVTRDLAEGISWYQLAWQNGYLPAANNLGVLYQGGLLGHPDMAKAIEFYSQAAERGLAQSQANLGLVYQKGIGVPPNPNLALKWFRLAAAQGHTTAMIGLGRLYQTGQGVSRDLAEAAAWFQKALDKGDELGTLNLGLLAEEQGQTEKARGLFEQAGDHGIAGAMVKLYGIYWDGVGITPDHVKAVAWLREAAETNYPYAQYLLGEYYFRRIQEVPGPGGQRIGANWPEALKWLTRAADQQSHEAQHELGLFYLEGRVVELDEPRGLDFLRSAADAGLPEGQRDLAKAYEEGIGKPRSLNDAPLALYQRAGAYDDLRLRYEYGLGTLPDAVAAAHWCCRNALAFDDAYCFDDHLDLKPQKWVRGGSIVYPFDRHLQIVNPPRSTYPREETLRLASLWLKSSRGDGDAARRLGELYVAGRNTPVSMVDAWLWFTLARDRGAANSPSTLSTIEARMSDRELADAKQRLPGMRQELADLAAQSRARDAQPNAR